MQRKGLFIIVAAFLVVFTVWKNSEGIDGPLGIKNNFPLFASAGNPSIVSASCEEGIDMGMQYSSLFVVKHSDDWDFELDFEVFMLDIELKKRLFDSLEISMELPLYSYNSGVLDSVLESYHSMFGFPDYGRSRRPKNEYLFVVKHRGKTVIKGESGEIMLGDIKMGLKYNLLDVDPVISLYGFIELPTGASKRGYGNGEIDMAVAILVDKKIFDSLDAYMNIGVVFPGDYKGYEDIGLNHYLYGGVSVKWQMDDTLALYLEFFAQESPFPETGIREIDEIVTILSIGGRYKITSSSFLTFSFSEDTNTAGAPDFKFRIAYNYRL